MSPPSSSFTTVARHPHRERSRANPMPDSATSRGRVSPATALVMGTDDAGADDEKNREIQRDSVVRRAGPEAAVRPRVTPAKMRAGRARPTDAAPRHTTQIPNKPNHQKARLARDSGDIPRARERRSGMDPLRLTTGLNAPVASNLEGGRGRCSHTPLKRNARFSASSGSDEAEMTNGLVASGDRASHVSLPRMVRSSMRSWTRTASCRRARKDEEDRRRRSRFARPTSHVAPTTARSGDGELVLAILVFSSVALHDSGLP